LLEVVDLLLHTGLQPAAWDEPSGWWWWRRSWWLRLHIPRLAIIRPCMIHTFPVIELNAVLIGCTPPQIQEAIRSIVAIGASISERSLNWSIRLGVLCASEPPGRPI
jgi:hypothetical protein